MITSKTIQPTVNRRQKKYLIISLLSLIFILALPAQAIKRIEANPINIAASLTEQPDSAAIASTCIFYGYLRQPSENGYEVYKHPNTSIIRYKYFPAEDGKRYPTIEVKSKGTQRVKAGILQNLNFKKNGNVYERRSISHQTSCTSASQGFLRFMNQPKVKNN